MVIGLKTRDSIDNARFTMWNLHDILHFNILDLMTKAYGSEGSAGPLGWDLPDVRTENDNDSGTPSPGFKVFRAKLVTHFSVGCAKSGVVWFQSAGVAEEA